MAENIIVPGSDTCLGQLRNGNAKLPIQVSALTGMETVLGHTLDVEVASEAGEIIDWVKRGGWLTTAQHDNVYSVTRASL